MTRRGSRHYAAPLDSMGTMYRTQRHRVGMKEYLFILIGLGLLSSAFNASHSYAYTSSTSQIDAYKLYAHTQIHSSSEYECYVQLINRESHWNYKANDHHGHYGMVQGNTPTLRNADPYYQIDWSIAYIRGRYRTHNPICTALQHSLRNNWY